MADIQNTRTVIATFDDYNSARQAARELENSGVPADSISIDSNVKTTGAGSEGYRSAEQHGGFSGWWHSLFGAGNEEEDRVSYEGALDRGQSILRATVPGQMIDSTVEVLNRVGAVDVDRRSESGTTARAGTSAPIPVIEEELKVGKRPVRRGGVRVYSHVMKQPVEEQIRLREEHVNVERRPVDRPMSPEEVSRLRDQTIEMTETAEEPVVSKEARVREEIVIGKEATERTETIRDEVRRTEVNVEQMGGQAGAESVNQGGTEAVFDDFTSDYRRNFAKAYGPGVDFDRVRPAYEYGYKCATDPRYRGKSWDKVEKDLRSDYEHRHPGSTWAEAQSAIRYGWEKATGRH